ncbi:MAG: methyltransferase domain-containing protein [Candidatus Spechtbacterales bacterium]|nr:methyltransferase domain-containing protein [Candidatus Spechtbacterales bacterium]
MAQKSKTNFINPYTLVEELGFKPGMSVADFGSGAGHWAMAIARSVGKEGKVHALDVRESVLQVLDGHIKMDGLFQIDTIPADLEQEEGSGLPDSSQDVVLCSNILHQLKKPRAVIKEAHRTLKKGGKLIIIDWEKDASLGPKDKISQEKAEKLAKEVGFKDKQKLEDIEESMHYCLIFVK